MEPVILMTERLVLRVPVAADAPVIATAADDEAVARWTTLPSPYLLEHAETFVGIAAAGWQDATSLNWTILRDGEFLGMIGLHAHAPGEAEIGFWLTAEARGFGYTPEAAAAVIDFAFGEESLALERIEWRAGVGNHASASVAQRLGFSYEGVLRQGLVSPRGRQDGWIASLLDTDDRDPKPWPITLR